MQVITIRVTDEMHKKIKQEAKEKGLTMNAYVVSSLWEICQVLNVNPMDFADERGGE